MRKKILLLVFSVYGSCAFAQKSFFGVNAGINVANQRSVTEVSGSGVTVLTSVGFRFNRVLPTFGAFYQFQFSETVGVRAGAQYMGLGYKNTIDSASVTINYLTLPLTFHYRAAKRLSFNAGGYVSFTLGGTKINNEDITKTYHKNDFGLSIGGEYDLGKNFSLAASYVIGLKNIWLNDSETIIPLVGPPITIHNKYTNRALQFTLIYKFRKTN